MFEDMQFCRKLLSSVKNNRTPRPFVGQLEPNAAIDAGTMLRLALYVIEWPHIVNGKDAPATLNS